MKILTVSTYDFDGGASRAAYRLHQGLLQAGEDSRMLVSDKFSSDARVIGPKSRFERGINLLWPQIDALPLVPCSRQNGSTWSLSWLGNGISAKIARLDPDIVHMHWVGFGFVPISALARFRKPIVWTFHDMWAFTGGCHYAGDCTRYTASCGCCPQLGSHRDYDLSRWIFGKKRREWDELNITVVTPSRWLAQCARTSTLFAGSRIEVIPNGLDTSVYQVVDKGAARRMLNLPEHDTLILFGAINATNEPRKGLATLKMALHHLQMRDPARVKLLVLGSGEPVEKEQLPYEVLYLGRLHDDISMALTYAAADVFVAPSIQENLPNTVMEAMACGTPCVSFAVGGFPDMIEHKRNGYLASPFDPSDLARGIAWVLEDSSRLASLSGHARNKVESEFALGNVAQKYSSLYRSLLPGDQ